MTRPSASQLKGKMGKYMRAGREVLVTDRGQPIAKLVPIKRHEAPAAIRVAKPRDPTAPPLGKVVIKGISYRGTDTTKMLREDRNRR